MELSGSDQCASAVQHVAFISTVDSKLVSPAEALDPTVDHLRNLYGGDGNAGPFPEERFLTPECRSVLRFRTELTYEDSREGQKPRH